MKKSSLIFVTFMILLGGCQKNSSPISNSTSSTPISVDYRDSALENVDSVVNEELKACFDFFYETAVTEENSPAYGLIPDRYNVKTDKRGAFASIASVGFGLATLPIGVEYGWITEEEGYDRAYKTLYSIMNKTHINGFLYHFLKMTNGDRYNTSIEISVIDTAILACGALTAGQYFGGDVQKIANRFYERIDWSWYYNEAKMMFYMGYSPEKGFTGEWNHYAEQLMMYVLAAGTPKKEYQVNKNKIPKDLAYLEGQYREDYLHDMEICQEFAKQNREVIAGEIIARMGLMLCVEGYFHTIHNYISFEDNIVRKGAISAKLGEKVLIPMNMKDGCIIGIGKGNEDWNKSAPHGAGRIMSRIKAKQTLNVDDFKEEMKGIYSTSVCKETLDEAPFVYKSMKEIVDNIKDTVDIVEIIKPIYNFKAKN